MDNNKRGINKHSFWKDLLDWDNKDSKKDDFDVNFDENDQIIIDEWTSNDESKNQMDDLRNQDVNQEQEVTLENNDVDKPFSWSRSTVNWDDWDNKVKKSLFYNYDKKNYLSDIKEDLSSIFTLINSSELKYNEMVQGGFVEFVDSILSISDENPIKSIYDFKNYLPRALEKINKVVFKKEYFMQIINEIQQKTTFLSYDAPDFKDLIKEKNDKSKNLNKEKDKSEDEEGTVDLRNEIQTLFTSSESISAVSGDVKVEKNPNSYDLVNANKDYLINNVVKLIVADESVNVRRLERLIAKILFEMRNGDRKDVVKSLSELQKEISNLNKDKFVNGTDGQKSISVVLDNLIEKSNKVVEIENKSVEKTIDEKEPTKKEETTKDSPSKKDESKKDEEVEKKDSENEVVEEVNQETPNKGSKPEGTKTKDVVQEDSVNESGNQGTKNGSHP
jgi:hypothetical protein